MKRNIYIILIAGLCFGLAPAAVLADGPEHWVTFDSSPGVSSGSGILADSGMYPVSDPVETGAVPMDSIRDKSSEPIDPSSTHYNPFHPELRPSDLGGGGE